MFTDRVAYEGSSANLSVSFFQLLSTSATAILKLLLLFNLLCSSKQSILVISTYLDRSWLTIINTALSRQDTVMVTMVNVKMAPTSDFLLTQSPAMKLNLNPKMSSPLTLAMKEAPVDSFSSLCIWASIFSLCSVYITII